MAKAKIKAVDTRLRPVEIQVQSIKENLIATVQGAVNAEHWFYNHGQNITFLSVLNESDKDVIIIFVNAHPDYTDVRKETVRGGGFSDIGNFNHLRFNDITNKVYFELSHHDNIKLMVRRVGI